LVVSHDNFLNRIGMVIGARVSQNDPLRSLRTYFSSCGKPLLLALDNAETILDPAIDKGLILEFMDELASFPGVYLLLTTRTVMLPNMQLVSHTSSPLDEMPQENILCRI